MAKQRQLEDFLSPYPLFVLSVPQMKALMNAYSHKHRTLGPEQRALFDPCNDWCELTLPWVFIISAPRLEELVHPAHVDWPLLNPIEIANLRVFISSKGDAALSPAPEPEWGSDDDDDPEWDSDDDDEELFYELDPDPEPDNDESDNVLYTQFPQPQFPQPEWDSDDVQPPEPTSDSDEGNAQRSTQVDTFSEEPLESSKGDYWRKYQNQHSLYSYPAAPGPRRIFTDQEDSKVLPKVSTANKKNTFYYGEEDSEDAYWDHGGRFSKENDWSDNEEEEDFENEKVWNDDFEDFDNQVSSVSPSYQAFRKRQAAPENKKT